MHSKFCAWLVTALLLGSIGTATAQPASPATRGEFRRTPIHLEHEGRVQLPQWVTWVGLLATAALGTVTVWSLVNTFEAREDVNLSAEHQSALEESRRQTWGTGIGTALAGIGTVLLAVLGTDWGTHPEAWADRHGAGVRLRFSL